MSRLRNIPVVLGERQIGLLQEACLDQTQKRVYAFTVSCGLRGRKIVLPEHVRVVEERFIMIDGAERFRRSDKPKRAIFARDTTGLLIGKVIDWALDEKTMEILALEIMQGYTFQEREKRIWIYDYNSLGEDEVSICIDLQDQPRLFEGGR